MNSNQLITLTEARNLLGVSKMKMARLVKEGRLRACGNPLDRREKLVDSKQVQKLLGQVRGKPKLAKEPNRLDRTEITTANRADKLPLSVRGVASLAPGTNLKAEIRKLRQQAAKQAEERLKRIVKKLEE